MKLNYKTGFGLALLLNVLVLQYSIAQDAEADSTQEDPSVTFFPARFTGNRNIGFGQQPARYVTSAISTVRGTDIEQNFNLNVGNALYGRLPGLTVTQGGSEPGAAVPGLFIRGVNTFGGASTAPLYIIDGYLSNGAGASNAFMQLRPEEIETISVLKDASATAIYGGRGANGVILVTTKTGHDGPLKIGFSTRQGFSHAQQLPKFLNSFEYATYFNEALANDGLPPRYTAADLKAYQDGSDPFFYPNVNWYDEVLRKIAPVSDYNLTLKGGDKTVRYFVMLNAITSQGLFKNFGNDNEESANSRYARYNFRSNLNLNLNKTLSVEFKIAGAVEQTDNPNAYNTGNTFTLLAQLPPNAFPVYNPVGNYGGNNTYANPVANLQSTGFYRNNSRTILSSLQINQQLDRFVPGLSASAGVSINNYFESGSRKSKGYPRYSISRGISGDTIYSPPIGQLTTLSGGEETLDQYRNLIIQAFLNYKRSFGKSDISGMLMFNSDNVTVFGPTGDPSVPTANSTDPYRHNAGAGRLTYVYNNRYIAEFSGGYMGSDIFAPGKRYGFFPAGSVGWIASNEKFLKANKTVSYLKIRGSYGLTGNDIIAGQGLSSRYAYYPTFGAGGYFFGTANASSGGNGENQIANPNITWEKEKHLNVGLEATVAKNFDVTLDYFKRDRYDILVASSSTTPQFMGINTPNRNQGKTASNGFEASLRYSSGVKKAFQFFVETNLSYYTNKIIFNAEALQLNTNLLSTGNRIGQPLGLKAIGFYSAADIAQRQLDPKKVPGVLTETIREGDVKYADIGGADGKPDGIIDANDRVPIGNVGTPNVTLGLHTGFRYKGFDLDAVFQAVSGNTTYLSGSNFYAFQGNGQIAPIALNRYTPATAATADYPRLSANNNLNNYQFSSFWQRNGSFIKMRSLEIGYTVSQRLSQKVKLNTARIFLTGTNLFSIDHIPYGDPESLSGYPVTRIITLGAKIQL